MNTKKWARSKTLDLTVINFTIIPNGHNDYSSFESEIDEKLTSFFTYKNDKQIEFISGENSVEIVNFINLILLVCI
jgi:hypothetical protein